MIMVCIDCLFDCGSLWGVDAAAWSVKLHRGWRFGGHFSWAHYIINMLVLAWFVVRMKEETKGILAVVLAWFDSWYWRRNRYQSLSVRWKISTMSNTHRNRPEYCSKNSAFEGFGGWQWIIGRSWMLLLISGLGSAKSPFDREVRAFEIWIGWMMVQCRQVHGVLLIEYITA